MRGRKKTEFKLLSFFLIIGMILSYITSYIPISVTEDAQLLQSKLENKANATALYRIDNWRDRVNSYAARFGEPVGGLEWSYADLDNEFKNVYCVQSGKSQSVAYDVYNAYDLKDTDLMTKYFRDEEHYKHFLWILENMYLTNMEDGSQEKTYMENQVFSHLSDDQKANYENMYDELNNYYAKAGLTVTNNKINPLLWHTTYYSGAWHTDTRKSEKSTPEAVQVDGRDNFIKIMQYYMLKSYVLQRDGNGGYKFGDNPIGEDGELTLDLKLYKYDDANYTHNTRQKPAEEVVETIDKSQKSAQFAKEWLTYLKTGYNSETYNINKYKGFYDENGAYNTTKINKDSATYDQDSKKIGPFKISNPFGFSVKVDNVSYGSNVLQYSVVDAAGNAVDLSSATTEEKDFYIQLNNDFSIDSTDNLQVGFSFDFGEVSTAKIFVPTEDIKDPQLMIDVVREHVTKNDAWTQQLENQIPDIALKKYVYSVNGTNVSERLQKIDLTALKENKKPHNASYSMNKTPVNVKLGDTVVYAIQLFNEGNIQGTATHIADHLPKYLEFVKAYSKNGDATKELKTEKLDDYNINIETELENMDAYNEEDTDETFKAKSQTIYVECKVTGINTGVYTNISEISEYRFEKGSDMDSSANTWSIGTTDRDSDEWKNYSNNHNEWLDGNFHDFGGQEDDDDFDKIIIENMDVALTKRIESKIAEDGTEVKLKSKDSDKEKSKIDISGYENVKNGQASDLRYNMNKEPASVNRKDKLVSVITVYNEGSVDATIKQITDYLPKGLKFNETETKKFNKDLPNIKYEYAESDNILKITLDGDKGISLKNINEATKENQESCDKHDIKIVTDVTEDANGRLYNSAAITEYGYIGTDNNYYSAVDAGVDKDSMGKESIELQAKHQTNYKAHEDKKEDLSKIDKNELQKEDDDDVDCVEIDYNPEFDLSLRKFIYSIQKDFNGEDNKPYTIEYGLKVPELTSKSLSILDWSKTAEYYHDKLKVLADTGDLVTYRIRVYNEGSGEDYSGRATEITDYLPEGLEFVSLEEGFDKEWEAKSSDNKVVLTYKGEKILAPDSIKNLVEINENKESGKKEEDYYQEVGIVCKVTANVVDGNSDSKIITNRAAITKHEAYEVYENKENKKVDNPKDRDSQPDQLTNPSLDTWYNQTIVNDKTPEPYYPGEQDDDDFDTIYIRNYSLEIEKTDGENTLAGAEFEIHKFKSIEDPDQQVPAQQLDKEDLDDLEKQINENGKGTYVSGMNSTELEKDVYIIKEIKAPEGYENLLEGYYIRLDATKSDYGVSIGKKYSLDNPLHYDIYIDNGNDDYTDDEHVPYKRKSKLGII